MIVAFSVSPSGGAPAGDEPDSVHDAVAAAVKVLDGNLRAGTLAALTLLAEVGAIPADAAARVIDLTGEKVLGGGVVVGEVRAGRGLVGAAVAG